MPNFVTDWGLAGDIASVVSTVLALLIAIGAAIRWLYRPWKRRKERRDSEHKTIHNLVRFLEDRRALYSHWAVEQPEMVIGSVRDMRSRLTADIEKLDERSAVLPYLLSMQAACRRFLTTVEATPQDQDPLSVIFAALSELRGVVNTQTDHLRRLYDIEKGPPHEDPNPFIGRYVRTVHIDVPPNWQPRQPNSESEAHEGSIEIYRDSTGQKRARRIMPNGEIVSDEEVHE